MVAKQPFPFPYVELYDGTGRHLGDTYPPLAEDNVLTPAYYQSKGLRPACRDFCLDPADARNDIGFVWMLPLDMSPGRANPARDRRSVGSGGGCPQDGGVPWCH